MRPYLRFSVLSGEVMTLLFMNLLKRRPVPPCQSDVRGYREAACAVKQGEAQDNPPRYMQLAIGHLRHAKDSLCLSPDRTVGLDWACVATLATETDARP